MVIVTPTQLQASQLVPELRAVLLRLDEVIVGHEDAKLALLLGLVSRQHVFLEGPPGCGKSLLAATFVKTTGLRPHVLTCHRDLRREELLGDVVLRRTRHEYGERLRFDWVPGSAAVAEILQLEDLTRAPGEALAVLLPILEGRRCGQDVGRYGGREYVPLQMAIATAQTQSELEVEGATDAVESTQLDRFALQVVLKGFLAAGDWLRCRALVEQTSSRGTDRTFDVEAVGETNALSARGWAELQRLYSSVRLDEVTLHSYRELLVRLRRILGVAFGSAPSNAQSNAPSSTPSSASFWSDRALSRSALAIIRAHAAACGRQVTEVKDLLALRLLIGRRLPSELHEAFVATLEEHVASQARQLSPTASFPSAQAELLGNEARGGARTLAAGDEVSQEDGVGDEPPAVLTPEAVTQRADVSLLMHAFAGRIDSGKSDPEGDPGGSPRGYKPLRRLDELLDADLVDAALFVDGCLPGQPRTYRRTRRVAGGAVAVLRDVSSSMAGQRNEWASGVVAGLVRVASRRRMRVGYVEFHHRAQPRLVRGKLLHRSYRKLGELARLAVPLGQTNYQEPLRVALEALARGHGKNRHVVMLTDGLPITGDIHVRQERALARRLGVQIHTVFVGDGECPVVLDDISLESRGLRFRARRAGGKLVVEERSTVPAP